MKISATRIKEKVRILIKKCHHCGEVMETMVEPQRCQSCNRSFLPLNYFGKVHANNSQEFYELFSPCNELDEEDLIKGIYALW
ncbi:MAG: hypothetical protein H6622_07125 [Halobacteriovoraceae bacterium]|nr:hypothetical protein [Halobacteriovoraceae bacterium]